MKFKEKNKVDCILPIVTHSNPIMNRTIYPWICNAPLADLFLVWQRANSQLRKPVASSHDVHLNIASRVKPPCLLVLSLSGQDRLDAPSGVNGILRGLLESGDYSLAIVGSLHGNVIVLLATQLLLIESDERY